MTAKHSMADLALFGGEPLFRKQLHVGRPNVGDRSDFLRQINEILDRGWLTNDGPVVQSFESRLADFLGVRHCIAVCNATTALQIAARALDLSGEVILPAFTFVATAHALGWQNITPVFCDVNPLTHTIDPAQAEGLITERTSAIVPVHLWGRPCDVEPLAHLAAKHGLKVLFDAAHAFGCSHAGRMIGNFGHAEVFSFHATKFFNTFEGGAVVTNDDLLAEKIRRMRNFGFNEQGTIMHLGMNGKMNEVQAAMGLTNLDSLGRFIEINRRNYEAYESGLADIPALRFLSYNQQEKCNFQYSIVELDEAIAGVTRDQVLELLWAENILARSYFFPGCHRSEPYCDVSGHCRGPLPVTDRLCRQTLALPTGTQLGPEQIERICEILRFIVGDGFEIAKSWKGEEVEVPA
jgi:dTDP-4-amino-4,6-dideoxygalactose transaminase